MITHKESTMLSIIVPVYNHESFIAQALDSILMQETSYKYEVLVYDDASTDNSAQLIKEYENLHRDLIKGYYYTENMYSKGIDPSSKLFNEAKGKYIIVLEGDDYWIDNNKIEIQISFLEKNSNYLAVSHNCIVVDKIGNPNGENYPECKETEYSIQHYEKGILPGQTATIMYRNFYKYEYFDTSFVDMFLIPGDRKLYFSLVVNGRIYCMQKAMSAYRHVVNEGTSFSANIEEYMSYDKNIEWHKQQMKYAYRTGNQMAIHIAEQQYFGVIYNSWRENQITILQLIKKIKHIKNPRHCIKKMIRNKRL